MKIKTKPTEIWQEYEKGRDYNTGINLYETVEQNEKFYIGKQWEGLNAPNLDKPVLNFLKRVGSYFVSQIVSDDVGISIEPHGDDDVLKMKADILVRECEKVIEAEKLTAKYRESIRDAVVDGDSAMYFSFDADTGRIGVEIIDNTKVLFGNPYIAEKEKQPYIILVRPMLLSSVREEAKEAGVDPETIQADDENYREDDIAGSAHGADRTTVLYKLWKQDNTVWYTKVTRNAVIKKPTNTGYRLYPIAWMNWEKVKNSYHGQAAITHLIPNQIAVNKLWAMALHHQQSFAFPKVLYDSSRIKQWTNRVGEAIAVSGDPNTAIATGYRAPDMSGQLTDVVDRTVSMTRDFMGASDAALGNVKPDNTSAIIAVQQASAAPLELNRLAFYQFVEDGVRVILDIICSDYGVRTVEITPPTDGTMQGQEISSIPAVVDFDGINIDLYDLRVDVGGASYWNEMTQISTIDNLFSKGIITDPVTYLEAIPDSYIKNKSKIIEQLKEQQMMREQMLIQEQMGGMPSAVPGM